MPKANKLEFCYNFGFLRLIVILEQLFSTRDFLIVITWGKSGVLLAYSEKRPGMLLNILQCVGQPPQQRNIWPKILIVPRLTNTALKLSIEIEFAMQVNVS